MKVKPQNNQIILKWSKESEEKFSEFGIILPVTEEVKLIETGEVIAKANKIVDKNGDIMELKVGNKVLFATFHPFEMELNGEKAYSLPASDIVAILE